jgi:membrane protein DedA with SNARE-associated domain
MHPAHTVLPHAAAQAIHTYGYGAVALAIGLESAGVPFPGEATLIATAIYAGHSHNLNIFIVVGVAAAAAIMGDNIGYWVGREVGYRLLHRYGRYVLLTEPRLKLGRYLFARHGGKVVFFARFITVLRTFAALLAGANQMNWPRFLAFNAAGAVVWASIYGAAAYMLGDAITQVEGPIGLGLLAAAMAAIGVGLFFLHRHGRQLEEMAEAAYPDTPDKPPAKTPREHEPVS